MEDIRDIHGVVSTHPWKLGIALGLIVACALWLLLRRKPRLAPRLSPYQEAYQALLACQELLEAGDDYALSIQASYILRRYLERSLQLPIVESTTAECQQLLFAQKDKAHAQACVSFLDRCDLIKFARAQIPPHERKSFIDRAVALLVKGEEEEKK